MAAGAWRFSGGAVETNKKFYFAMMHEVILVDKDDRAIGVMDKLKAHQIGTLHRAFSVFVFNNNGQLLLQQRAVGKYHSGGLWTNTCCSHPLPDEDVLSAANRRLKEEMGLNCHLQKQFDFLYRAEVDNDLIEHEFDHVFFGTTDENPSPSADEVSSWKWADMNEIEDLLKEQPEIFTTWFRIVWPRVSAEKSNNFVKS
jgi:isopentenyl-diphosphate delta-isomerase